MGMSKPMFLMTFRRPKYREAILHLTHPQFTCSVGVYHRWFETLYYLGRHFADFLHYFLLKDCLAKMAFSSTLVDSNRVSFTIEGEVQCMKTDANLDIGGLIAFKIFVEGIVATSLTCNIDASPSATLKDNNLRKNNRLSKNKDVPCEKGTPV